MSSPDEPKRTRANFPWIFGTLVVGGVILLLTIVTADSSARLGLWQSFLINVGSAVALASLLGFVEPRLRKNYIEATTRKIEAATERVEARVEARVEELEERVESARTLFENYLAAEDNAVAAAADRPDFYTIADALVAANNAHAIDQFRGVAVPASEGIPAVVIGFHYATPVHNGRRDVLLVSPSILEDPPPNGFWAPMQYSWQPGAPSEEFGAFIMTELRNSRLKDVAAKVHWAETIDRLVEALALALESSTSDGKLTGWLIEKGPGGWALTNAGIEYVGRGVIAPAGSFPGPIISALGAAARQRRGEEVREPWMDLERPEWAEPDEWEYMVSRARTMLPGANLPVLMQPPYVASSNVPKRPTPRPPLPPALR
ncbi:hypothetical protein [Sinomonas sp. ASV322]|uniref:hypothetical protein n=1 Tax=Sinomonas sp. ASV322 TaxID=3041920 RepID=UPI0027DAB9A7|nr:hypothetical protein [Sinomonas sp. ASV322]MDQ4504440.1 hypothetical protein [Sinomonas sp. ASV322]